MTKGLMLRCDDLADPLDRLIAKYGGRVPRYTSYPTAVQFSPAIGESDYRVWLGALSRADGALSICIHIPLRAAMLVLRLQHQGRERARADP